VRFLAPPAACHGQASDAATILPSGHSKAAAAGRRAHRQSRASQPAATTANLHGSTARQAECSEHRQHPHPPRHGQHKKTAQLISYVITSCKTEKRHGKFAAEKTYTA